MALDTARRLGGRPSGRRVPLLSVVVEVHNAQDELAGCLDSLLSQTLQEIEVIVVDHGSHDHSAEILTRYAAADERVTVIAQADAGPGAARNAGVAAATAPYLAFLGSDDTIPAEAYAYLLGVLQRTGSDFAVGAVQGVKHGRRSRPRWVDDVHRVERLGITIEDFPDAMQDVVPCNRVFRRAFWSTHITAFPTGIAFDDQVCLVAAYVRAHAFDLLPSTTSSVHVRTDPAPGWQQGPLLSTLRDRVAANELAWAVVSAEASPPVRAAWLGRVLDSDLSRFVDGAWSADEEFRDLLQAAASRFSRRADPATWSHVRVERKLRLALAAAGRWEAAEELIEYFQRSGPVPETVVENGRVLVADPALRRASTEPALLELGERQTALSSCLSTVRWGSDGRLVVEGWAYIGGVDLSEAPLQLSAVLRDGGTGATVPLPVGRRVTPAVNRWAKHPHQDYAAAGFALSIDVDALPRTGAARSTRWQLVLQAEAAGLRRSGAVHSYVRTGIGTRMRARALESPAERIRLVPYLDDRLGFVLHVRLDRLRAVGLTAGPSSRSTPSSGADGARLGGTIAALRPLDAGLRQVVARQNGVTVASAGLVARPDGSHDFELSLPLPNRPPHWDFRVVDSEGRLLRVSWPAEATAGAEIGGYGPLTARWRRSPRGFVQISTQPVVFRAHAVQVGADTISVVVGLQGVVGLPGVGLPGVDDPAGLAQSVLARAELRSPLLTLTASSVEPTSEGLFRLVFPTRAARWGDDEARPLPSDTYTVELPLPSDQVAACGVVPQLMEHLPASETTAAHRVTVARRAGTDRLTLDLRAPLGDDERGPLAQHRLASEFAELEPELDDAVFFQCFRGEFATDSQLAIHHELHRRRAPVDLVWGVADHSVPLPEGARPVLFGSRAWYQAIAGSRFLCNNNDFDRFFFRRPGQQFLQTFHGYPFKSMGVSFWRARHLSARGIAEECSRRTDAWTSILVPEAFCEELYRQEYLYDGDVLVTGYPRNDAIVNAEPGAREEILRRLGIAPDKTVVMYGPTWRDTIATGDWSATFFDALQLDELAEALGPDHVLLLRGHNFNMRQGVPQPSHSQIVDVTRYPEITDLILAADVAILDYSSLRFDWVLTGKPVLFFVPDLADYLSARTALFEYGPTAPGPLLSTTAEVIEAVQNLESVSKDYAGARESFNSRFNRLHDGGCAARVVDAFFGAVPGVVQDGVVSR